MLMAFAVLRFCAPATQAMAHEAPHHSRDHVRRRRHKALACLHRGQAEAISRHRRDGHLVRRNRARACSGRSRRALVRTAAWCSAMSSTRPGSRRNWRTSASPPAPSCSSQRRATPPQSPPSPPPLPPSAIPRRWCCCCQPITSSPTAPPSSPPSSAPPRSHANASSPSASQPNRPETGYGYIKTRPGTGRRRVRDRLVQEKPNARHRASNIWPRAVIPGTLACSCSRPALLLRGIRRQPRHSRRRAGCAKGARRDGARGAVSTRRVSRRVPPRRSISR